jgi:serine/threonine protein kinase
MTIFNCAQGHQWTVADQSSDTVVCPYCGGMGSARAIKRSAIPDRIGSYRVSEALGHGGMGVVYKARQLGLDRFVAIKMLITGRYSDAGAIGRVRQEAEAISRLQHANIVQIHEIGEHEGRPFLVLEYVAAGSNLGQLRGKPLPSTVAARLVQALSRAIAHAHRRGIVHRDIKPANVLLAWPDQESAPQLDGNLTSFQIFDDVIPKISDFGLAKRLDINSGQTLIGTILGTPSYMAPEQAAARMDEVGPASDIYSLGAVLYELVTGRPPFRAETALATLEQVTEDDPVPPRQLQPGVARDLETICLKCLEKDPAKRYVTADDLAADLGRYLNQEPIVARRQNLFVYVSKWVRRRPAAAALIFVSVLALLTLIIGSQWYSSLVRKERNLAEANFSMALNAVDEMLTQVGDEKLAYEPRMEEKRQALLQNALGFYKRFLHERQGDRRLQIETAYAYRRMADVEKLLGNYDAAQSAYLEAIRLFKVLQGKRSVAEYRRWEAYCWNYLGESQRLSSRPQEAFTSYTNALKLQQKLTQEFPELLDYQLELARTHYNVGILWRETNRLQRSEKELREALPILQALVKKDGKRGDFRFELSRVHTNVGSVMRDTNRATLAIEEFTEAISLLAKLVAEHPENTDFRHELAVAHTNRGNAYHISNQIDEARADYEVARQDLSSLTLDYPRVPSFAQEISNTENSLAAMLHKAEGFAAAEKVWLDASTRLLFARAPRGDEVPVR